MWRGLFGIHFSLVPKPWASRAPRASSMGWPFLGVGAWEGRQTTGESLEATGLSNAGLWRELAFGLWCQPPGAVALWAEAGGSQATAPACPQGASRTLGPHSDWLLSKLLHSRLLWGTAVSPWASHTLYTHCRGAARLGGLQILFLDLSIPPFRKPYSSSKS